MVNYAKMQAILCHAASEAMDAMPINVHTLQAYLILRDAIVEIEELYYEGCEEEGCEAEKAL